MRRVASRKANMDARPFHEKPKYLRRAILEAKQNSMCLICGISDWMGKPIVLHLDHVNGDNSDNREENNRLICPNCHSQTETYAGKNVKR